MSSKFDVYMLQDFVPVPIGAAESLAQAEEIIKTQLGEHRAFLVYSQPTGVNVFYQRTPEGLISFSKLTQAASA